MLRYSFAAGLFVSRQPCASGSTALRLRVSRQPCASVSAGSPAPPASRRMPPLLRKRFSSSDLELTERLLAVRENALELDDGRPAFLKAALGKASFACPEDPSVEAVSDPQTFRTHPFRPNFVCMDGRGGRSGARGVWIGMLGWARCWWTFSTCPFRTTVGTLAGRRAGLRRSKVGGAAL